MRIIISVVSLLIMGAVLLQKSRTPVGVSPTTRRAYQERNKRDVQMIKAADPGLSSVLMDEEWVQAERWKNFQKEIPRFVKTQDVVSVYISKTSDTGEFVIMITDADGKRTSYWTEGSEINKVLLVRSLSAY